MLRLLWSLLLVVGIANVSHAQAKIDAPRMFEHAMLLFNRGDYQSAYPYFSTLIYEKFADPRAYYYRGLSAWRMGAYESAKDDFRSGAELEMANPDGLGLLAFQMYRIQGAARLALEAARNDARLAAYERREKERWQRFSGATENVTAPAPMPPAAEKVE
ncbi:MAG: hypothetical protein JNM18_06915 [Planctomycetaceae bacterium]|nr:hypothetical protein [Planctomycetaceae bacterium]